MSRTKTLAIVSEKGGAGKTILAVNLAVAAEARGLATAIFDLDPRANSAVWEHPDLENPGRGASPGAPPATLASAGPSERRRPG